MLIVDILLKSEMRTICLLTSMSIISLCFFLWQTVLKNYRMLVINLLYTCTPLKWSSYFVRLRHRGPDWSGLHCHEDCYLAHQRLAIIDPTSGDQPLYNEDKTVVVTVCIWIRNNFTVSTHFFMLTVEFATNLFNCSAFGKCHLFQKSVMPINSDIRNQSNNPNTMN